MMGSEYKTEEVKLVSQLFLHLIQESSSDNEYRVETKPVEVFASERYLSRTLLISQRQSRQACSILIDLGYINSKRIASKAVYSLTDKILKSSIEITNPNSVSDSVFKLLNYTNYKLECLSAFDGHYLQKDNVFHLHFLQKVLQHYRNDDEECKREIDLCIESIINSSSKYLSVRSLAYLLRKRMKHIDKRKKIPQRLFKVEDPFLKRRYYQKHD